jgi:uncharacterized protein
MIVISDSSILINLAWIKQLHLLAHLFGEVIVPTAVWREVVEEGAGKPGALEMKAADWLQVKEPENKPLIHALRQDLDAGEAEAIALAIEQHADLLLMDERIGRAAAQHFNLPIIGLVGILITAKQKKMLPEIKSSLDSLRQQAGFYISEALYQRVLRDADESTNEKNA